MRARFNTLALALAALVPFSAAADEADGMFSFSGFGTLGAVHSSEDQADFVASSTPSGAGHSHATATTPDTRLAVQVDARFSAKLSGVVQVISEYDYENSYKPQVELAHLKYAFTPALGLRAGRLTAPIFMLSEYRKVGYAMPWVRPPREVYNTAISLDGAALSYKFNLGDVAFTAQAFGGSADEATFELHDARGVNLSADYGSSSFFGSYNQTRIDVKNAQLSALFNFYRPRFAALADQYEVKNDKLTFASLGYAFDPGSWFARSEITRIDGEDNVLSKTTNFYVSAGVRKGAFTPYATYARVERDSADSIGAADPIGVINGALSSTDESRQSLTVGSRWDFRDSAALKLELSHVDNASNSNGGLINLQPGFQTGRSYNLLSASVDFVF